MLCNLKLMDWNPFQLSLHFHFIRKLDAAIAHATFQMPVTLARLIGKIVEFAHFFYKILKFPK